MSTNPFLSPPLSNPSHFPPFSNPFSDSYRPISLSSNPNSLRKPKPVYSFNPQNSDTNKASVEPKNPNSSSSSKQISPENAAIKMPSAPWMKGPLLLEPNQVLDLSKSRNKNSPNGKDCKLDRSLTEKVSGRMGKKALKQIFQSIEKLQETKNLETSKNSEEFESGFSLEQSVGGGNSNSGLQKLQETQNSNNKKNPEKFEFGVSLEQSVGSGNSNSGLGKLQETQNSKNMNSPEEFEFGFSLEQFGVDADSKSGKRMPWLKDERLVFRRMKREKVVTAAELVLDGVLLEKLRGEASRMRKWVKIMKAGVTQSVVDQIHWLWKNNELVMLKFDIPLCRNMDRAREIVEIKTGGLVVWCRKDVLVVYRGCNSEFKSKASPVMNSRFCGGHEIFSSTTHYPVCGDNTIVSQEKSDDGAIDENTSLDEDGYEENISINGSLFEREADRLLDGLGPRFVDWWRPKPLPVDADLLPEVVPGFKPPFRLCPPHSRSKLTDAELTYLRKLARPLPTHFVLGRNRKLQGLAVAILKLWEKCYIAKIAVKFGALNTSNEQMAYELKYLTGGVLLLRNKFYIILYRGKDFLPCTVANLVVEREMELRSCQLQEEALRLKAAETFYLTTETSKSSGAAGTLSEFQNIQLECGSLVNENREVELQLEAEKERLEKELRNQERKLFILKSKIEMSGKVLSKLNSTLGPNEEDADHELLTDEERECYRKMGLKLASSLVLGRRGVFDGVIEGLHQHWKHREIAKVITMQRLFSQAIYTAKTLEAKSGGSLVSVDKLKEGHAVIIYRGKNYRRPPKLEPGKLLTKREALSRSLEMQRIGSLKFFAYQREREISDLKLKLKYMKVGELMKEKFHKHELARESVINTHFIRGPVFSEALEL